MSPTLFSPVPDLIADICRGKMVVLVDDEGRENEGDVIIAAEHVSAGAINFMARHCRGLICLTLTPERCDELQLAPMVQRNGTRHGTAFTVSIEAATGVDTGISAADRARTIAVAVDPESTPASLVQPGHVFPLRAASGGVLMRAGHTEAGCDLARLAGLRPAAVICEIMNEDGTMARVPELVEFAREHGVKLGTIADLIEFRSRAERLIDLAGHRPLETPFGAFAARTYRDSFGGVHLALTAGDWTEDDLVSVRVHEPVSIMDVLDTTAGSHSWPLPQALRRIHTDGRGAVLLLNATESAAALVDAAEVREAPTELPNPPQESDLRTYGVGAQILLDLGIRRMRILGNPRRFPSMSGYGLHVEAFESPDGSVDPS